MRGRKNRDIVEINDMNFDEVSDSFEGVFHAEGWSAVETIGPAGRKDKDAPRGGIRTDKPGAKTTPLCGSP